MLNTLYEEAEKLGYKPRDVQIKAVEWLQSVWDSENKCKILSSPVASGKSLIAKTISEYNKKKELMTAVLTPQNILIDQYFNEFNDLNFLKGKSHYTCEKYQMGCDEGIQINDEADTECENCPYVESKRKAYEEYITIFNCMSYYILPKSDKEGIIYYVDTIIVDEFQSLPSILREMSSIKVWWHDLKWEHGITCSIPNIIELLSKYSKSLNSYIYNKDLERKDRLKLINQQKRINFVTYNLENNGQYYICEESKEKFKGIMTDVLIIRPKYVPPQVAKGFFKIAKKVVLMSGTAFSNIWEELGFKDVDYIDLPSPIPIDRRQIFITKSIKLSYKEDHLDKWDMLQELAKQIKDIINKYHPKDNGVILLPYSLAADLKSLMSEDHFIHMDKSTKKSKIQAFMAGETYGVGIFSGSYEGISLDDCVSRFTIIPKCTYPNLKDTVVKVRMKEYPLSYNLETITTIIQASGRSTRSELDFSYTYILDENFLSLYPRVRKHVPKYFSEALNFGYPTTQQIQKYNQFQRDYENI